jgi:hypothetical protein
VTPKEPETKPECASQLLAGMPSDSQYDRLIFYLPADAEKVEEMKRQGWELQPKFPDGTDPKVTVVVLVRNRPRE